MKKDKTQSTTTKIMQLSNDIYLIIDLITYIVIIKCQLILSSRLNREADRIGVPKIDPKTADT